MIVKITHPGNPYHGQEGLVTRVSHGAHVDVLLTLDDGLRVRIDAAWTDYWERKGEEVPRLSCVMSVERARRVGELLGRWILRAETEKTADEV